MTIIGEEMSDAEWLRQKAHQLRLAGSALDADFSVALTDGLEAIANRLSSSPEVVTALVDALQSIKAHCEPQPSPLAKAIVATCDAALSKVTVV